MMDSTFASDNAAGVHPEVLAAIDRANHGFATGYGHDDWTAEATAHVRRHFGAAADGMFVLGGTGANILALAPLREPYEAVVCADSSHLWNDECAAPEHFLGGKLIPVPATGGKLTADAVREAVPVRPAVHHAQPRVLSLAQPTELGTLYTPDELADLVAFARERGWLVHVDGARLANAAAALDVDLDAFGRGAGVDAVSFGATKNGALAAEVVVMFDPALRERAAYYRKQAAHLASKMRFVAVQLTAMLEGDLWRRCAAHANRMAARLAAALRSVSGVEISYPVETNAVFFRMSPGEAAALRRRYALVPWNTDGDLLRAMTSWATREAQVDDFAAAVARAASVPA